MNEMEERYARFGAFVAGTMDGYRATERNATNKDLTLMLIEQAMRTYGVEIA